VPEQVFWPGAQLPAHAPLAHVWFTHACAAPQLPLVSHVSKPLLDESHCVPPGEHDPTHAPLTHALLTHAVAFVQLPVPSHVCGWMLVRHWACPGAHTPWHAPATHVWFEHAEPVLCQAPLELQVCGC
jgi:hypothetical protein